MDRDFDEKQRSIMSRTVEECANQTLLRDEAPLFKAQRFLIARRACWAAGLRHPLVHRAAVRGARREGDLRRVAGQRRALPAFV